MPSTYKKSYQMDSEARLEAKRTTTQADLQARLTMPSIAPAEENNNVPVFGYSAAEVLSGKAELPTQREIARADVPEAMRLVSQLHELHQQLEEETDPDMIETYQEMVDETNADIDRVFPTPNTKDDPGFKYAASATRDELARLITTENEKPQPNTDRLNALHFLVNLLEEAAAPDFKSLNLPPFDKASDEAEFPAPKWELDQILGTP